MCDVLAHVLAHGSILGSPSLKEGKLLTSLLDGDESFSREDKAERGHNLKHRLGEGHHI